MPTVSRTIMGGAVVAVFANGYTDDGQVKTINKTMSNVRSGATDEAKYDVVEAIAGLQDLELEEILDREYGRLTKGF